MLVQVTALGISTLRSDVRTAALVMLTEMILIARAAREPIE